METKYRFPLPGGGYTEVRTPEEIPPGITAEEIIVPDPTPEEIQAEEWEADVNSETEKYIKRIRDGREAYAKISAEFRLAKLNGIITEEAHGIIEDTLIPVRNEVLAGQWISGLQKLQAIGGAVIGGVLYNRLVNQINIYINENY